jgi:hypothetical protein
MPLTQVVAGNRVLASDLNQYYNILKGVAASGEAVTLIYNAAGSLIFQPSSDPAAGTEVLQIKNNAGTVQSALSFDGRLYPGDGAVGTPGVAFETDKDTGLYRIAANNLGIAVGGVKQVDLTTAAITFAQNATFSGKIAGIAAPDADYGLTMTGSATANGLLVTVGNTSGQNIIQLRNSGGTDKFVVDGTGATTIAGSSITVGGATGGKVIAAGTLTAGGLLGSAVQVATSGPLIYSGSGAPSISAAVKGSLYLRSDGSGTTDRIYVAKDTAGAWASLTAAS